MRKTSYLIVISVIVLGLVNCGVENRNGNASSPPPANITPNTNITNPNTNVANAESNTVVVGGVTRITFAKGASSGTASVNLPPNGSEQFTVEGNYGQKIKITAGTKDAIVKIISGTDRKVESPGGGLVVSITVSGDVIFEIKNASDKELKTTVRVEITDGY